MNIVIDLKQWKSDQKIKYTRIIIDIIINKLEVLKICNEERSVPLLDELNSISTATHITSI